MNGDGKAARGNRIFSLGIPFAFLLACAGQALLLFPSLIPAGALAYAGALILIGLEIRSEVAGIPVDAADFSRNTAAFLLLGVLLVAFFLRRFEIGLIPWGLNNDEGIEGLIACRFLAGEPLAPFSSIGLSRETLFHVLLMPLFMILGPGIPALRLLSLIAGLAAVGLIYCTGKELLGTRKAGLFAAALLAVSPWHVLYSRTGLRNILLPVFVLGALLGFRRALSRRRWTLFAATGAWVGMGMYSYTSFRVVPVVLVLWVLAKSRRRKPAAMTTKEVLATVVPFLVLMIPQILVAVRDPSGFLLRGNYVLAQTPEASWTRNLLFSFLLPVYHPARYGVMQSPSFFSDGVSLVYAAVGRSPETVVSAAVMVLGLATVLLRFFRTRREGEGVILLLFFTTLLTVGLAGPSLTRMIGVLPLWCLCGAVFLEALDRRLQAAVPKTAARAGMAVVLITATVLGYEQYFLRAGRSGKAMFYFAPTQTIMGLYASSQAFDHPVVVLYTEQPEALQFLTFVRSSRISLRNDPSGIDVKQLAGAPGRVEFVVENHRRFLELMQRMAAEFPWAEGTALSDAQHRLQLPVAYAVDLDPAKRPSAPAPAGLDTPAPPPPPP